MENTVASSCKISPIRSIAATANVLYYDTVTNEVSYAAKTFVIEHPQNPSKYLVHACLEGPEAGVYYRGCSAIEGTEKTIELPDYVTALATDFTVLVTPVYNGAIRTLNCSDIENNKFTVYGEKGKFNWYVCGKRCSINVEPDRAFVNVKGDGPYKYI